VALAGHRFNFTEIFPSGVQEFSLLGIRVEENLRADVPPTFVHSFSFTNDGTAIVAVSALSSLETFTIPEPATLLIAALGLLGMVLRPKLSGRIFSRCLRRTGPGQSRPESPQALT
jgi:hypothetical protein